ncbi:MULTISPECIES: DNA cytosine methyltransferase [unclassified Campylobacter]|uniref:DNA cytosine methyltransferase n=1 Tax=unclassified Campylobacter TaxID=2593542 RepID=UPI0021E03F2D|nr:MULTISPECIES: DNA (cytosine-5-)-methyltransferase [unclassified Campylobacter]
MSKKHKTKIIVLENVKNLISHNKKQTFNTMLKLLDNLEYNYFYEMLNTKDFGFLQQRTRIFIVAILREFSNIKFEFPKGYKLKISTQDLLDKNVDKNYFLSKKIAKTILSWGSGGYKAEPSINCKISKTLTATMCKMHRASQDNYVTNELNFAKFNDDNLINVRKLTPNECSKLQGFPNSWKQVVSDTQAYKQFGNAVSVNVSNALAKNIKQFLNLK